MTADSKPGAYRWLNLDHPDISFFNLPRPIPWPADAEPWEEHGDFPFSVLRRGIQLLEKDQSAPANSAWQTVKKLLNEMDGLSAALENGDLQAAETRLRRMERPHAQCPMVWYNLAFVLKQRSRWREALACYRQAAVLAPRLEYIWMRRGELEEQLQMKREAICSFKMALRLLPSHPQAQAALARLGVLREVHRLNDDGQWETAYLTPARFRSLMVREIDRCAGDAARLKTWLQQFFSGHEGKLAVYAAEKLLALNPADAEARRLLGESWRVARRYTKAAEILEECLQDRPADAWAHYYLALTRQKLKDPGAFEAHLSAALAVDPNLMPAITARFGLQPKMRDPAREGVVCEWAEATKSAQGFFLASLLARNRGELKLCLSRAARAHELAREDRQILLHYTSELMACDEKEWVAALIKPRLSDGPGDFELKYQFGHALHKLGLKQEASKTLRAALAVERAMPPDWRESFEASLDRWEGRMAVSEIDVEMYDGGTVRRPIVVLVDGQEVTEIVPGGVGAPLRRVIEVELEEPGSTAEICLQQGWQRGGLEPVSLGCFQMHEIDADAAATEPPFFWVGVNKSGQVEVGARQGTRSLPVTWSLYPLPMAA